MIKKVGIAVLFAASMGVATSAHAFLNFGCDSKSVMAKEHTVLRGDNLLNTVFNIVRRNFGGRNCIIIW